ncbi:MAG: sigma-70 family RNA polymerase sigma factor [Deltaproteobacteria bacterium]|nr:sigma-70 family RNA polymerase sigma factor [Deltaproteobacteria bacterium]
MTAATDKELVTKCLAGDEAAWTKLHARLYPSIRYVTHWQKWHFSRDKSEDMIQDVYLGIVTSLKNFHFDCSLETFAVNITKNKCISEIRRLNAVKREGEQESMSLDERDSENMPRVPVPQTQPSFLGELQQQETADLFEKAFQDLGEKCSTIIKLKYFDNRSYDEIVGILRAPMGTVASRLKRCLLELRTICEKFREDLL